MFASADVSHQKKGPIQCLRKSGHHLAARSLTPDDPACQVTRNLELYALLRPWNRTIAASLALRNTGIVHPGEETK